MRDFLPADVRRRNYVINIVKEVYERYGFEPLETPAVENIETLLGKYGEEGNQLIFKILKRGEHEKTGEADLALRYDLTVPLARVVAEYKNQLPKFFKRYQIQPVWRADRPARGRFREFYQCDVDVCGSKSMIVEAELCAAVSDVLVRLGFNDFTIRLNHRKVLEGILDTAGVPSDKHGDALVALDKLDKIGTEGVAAEFAQRFINEESAEKLIDFFSGMRKDFAKYEMGKNFNFVSLLQMASFIGNKFPSLEDIQLGRLIEGVGGDNALNILLDLSREKETYAKGIEELHSIVSFLASTNASSHIKIDPSLARGLSYYTGAIMEISVPDLAGSLGGGGRYDNLVGMFSGQDVPACGFSLGLERIIVVMTQRRMFPDDLITTPADCMVTIWNEESIADSLALANELRQSGLRVEVYPEADKLGKQFKYASSRGINFVCILGDDERANNKVALKNMTTGEQEMVERNKVTIKMKG